MKNQFILQKFLQVMERRCYHEWGLRHFIAQPRGSDTSPHSMVDVEAGIRLALPHLKELYVDYGALSLTPPPPRRLLWL